MALAWDSKMVENAFVGRKWSAKFSLPRFQRVVFAPYAPSLRLIIFPSREVTGWHFCFVKAFCSPVKKDKLIWLVLQLNLASHWRGFGPYISNTQIITTNFATPFIFYTPPETKPRSCVLGIKASFYCYNFWKKQTGTLCSAEWPWEDVLLNMTRDVFEPITALNLTLKVVAVTMSRGHVILLHRRHVALALALQVFLSGQLFQYNFELFPAFSHLVY